MSYPQEPGHRKTDTSQDAAASMAGNAQSLREQVLGLLRNQPLTADEAAGLMEESVLAIRPRFTELRRIGAIVDSGHRRTNASGRSAIVWRVKGVLEMNNDTNGAQ